ncbi:MAG: DUF4065 domain-containing protein [Parcubacteria group bacterium]|nr:DUF4065 domain-containing protein [Parcubacteria group bacterium]
MVYKINLQLKKLREKAGMSQAYMAKTLEMSRPTYIQLEKGVRELTISEAEKLASIFGLSLDKFLAGKSPKPLNVILEKEKSKKKSEKLDIRISVPQKNVKKFTEVLLYILEKVGAKPNIGQTVIYKLLYFIDFDFYEKYEEQLMGCVYIKNHFGPTPVGFDKIVEQMKKKGEIEKVKSKYFQYEQKKYLPRRKPNLSRLSGLEVAHIDDVLNRLSDKSAKELSEYSHSDVPWITAEDGKPMSYEAVFYRTNETSQREYKDEL